jgi:L-rhamnose mutarotase
MPRVMFTISYGIKPEQRSNYLALIAEVKNHLVNVGKKNYSVFETKGKKNQFSEVYSFQSEEEFEALDDNQDERTQELLSKLEACVDEYGMKYSASVEL